MPSTHRPRCGAILDSIGSSPYDEPGQRHKQGVSNESRAVGRKCVDLGGGFGFVWLIFVVLYIAAWWKIFDKAGLHGWGVLIPIYNLYLTCKVAGRPGWWTILLLIPLINIVVFLIVSIDVAKNFGKGTGFGVGLWILPMILGLVLGFGDATWTKPPNPSRI